MTETVLIDLLRTAGVGTALAVLMFHFYRKDARMWYLQHAELLDRVNAQHLEVLHVIKENTAAMTMVAERLEHVVGVALDER
jgi:hypothetical protein